MKREILFRGKCLKTKEWVYGYYYNGNLNNPCLINKDVSRVHHEIAPDTLGQYTGVRDDNDNMVFEGDILRVYSQHGDSFEDLEVFFYIGYFALKNKHVKPMYYADESFEVLTKFIFNGYEVIGNTHDNEK